MKYESVADITSVDAARWFIAEDTADDPVSLETDALGRQHGILHTHDGQCRVEDGDYIVRLPEDESGKQRLLCMSPGDFDKKYRPASVPAKKLATKAGE